MKHPGLRLVRGWLGALIMTSLAAASHSLAGGDLPPLPILALVLAVCGSLCTALAGGGLSLWRTSTAVILSQGLYHVVFGLCGPGFGMTHPLVRAHAGHHGAHGGFTLDTSVLLAGPSAVGATHAAAMPWAHLLAACSTVVMLRKGGVAVLALFRVLCLATPVAILRTGLPTAVGRPRPWTAVQAPGLPDLGVPLRALRRRGPPSPAAFAIR